MSSAAARFGETVASTALAAAAFGERTARWGAGFLSFAAELGLGLASPRFFFWRRWRTESWDGGRGGRMGERGVLGSKGAHEGAPRP